jgi:hypothetical protein
MHEMAAMTSLSPRKSCRRPKRSSVRKRSQADRCADEVPDKVLSTCTERLAERYFYGYMVPSKAACRFLGLNTTAGFILRSGAKGSDSLPQYATA